MIACFMKVFIIGMLLKNVRNNSFSIQKKYTFAAFFLEIVGFGQIRRILG